jgi:hypothetical protein
MSYRLFLYLQLNRLLIHRHPTEQNRKKQEGKGPLRRAVEHLTDAG